MNILLVGPIFDKVCLDGYHFDKVIAVDKGIDNAISRNLTIDVAIGDFDSLNDKSKLLSIPEIIEFNVKKDDTDFECALKYLKKDKNINEIYAIGFMFGNRIDHMLENVLLINKYSFLNIKFIQEKSEMFILNKGKHIIDKNNYKYISFFSFENTKICLNDGFKYQTVDDIISLNDLKYISNEIIDDSAIIEIDNKVLVILSND